MSNWKEYKLGEIANINMGQSPKSDTYNNEKIGLPFFQGNRTFGRLYPTIDTYCSNPLKTADKDDILFSVRAPVGDINYSPERVCIGRGLCSIKSKYGNQTFLFYLLNFIKQEIINKESGTVFGSVNKNTLEGIKLSIPDLPTQSAIAEILSSLDDKIELNNKINQELENLAQTLFKQWFIDFEFPDENGYPYKSSGGEMVDSELGKIPKGWEVYSMSDLLETVSKTYPLKNVEEVIFLNTGDIQDGKFLHKNISDPKILPGQAKKSISINDILYSEIRPANKRFAYVHFDTSKYVVSTKLMVLRSKVEINSLFQYFILTQNEQIEYLQRLAESRSGTFPQITFSEVSTIKIALPSFDKVNLFVENVLEPFFSSKFSSEFENQELTNLRDTLLPKLISGELEVKNVNI
jgi:type I restriction enzyme, S subunit